MQRWDGWVPRIPWGFVSWEVGKTQLESSFVLLSLSLLSLSP